MLCQCGSFFFKQNKQGAKVSTSTGDTGRSLLVSHTTHKPKGSGPSGEHTEHSTEGQLQNWNLSLLKLPGNGKPGCGLVDVKHARVP